MSDFDRIKNNYRDYLKNEDDQVWLTALLRLRNSFSYKIDQIEKTIILLESLYIHTESEKVYNDLLALAKKTYKLKILETDRITGKPSKFKIVETSQGGRA